MTDPGDLRHAPSSPVSEWRRRFLLRAGQYLRLDTGIESIRPADAWQAGNGMLEIGRLRRVCRILSSNAVFRGQE